MSWLRRRIPFVLVIAAVLLAFVLYYPYSPGGRQAATMRKMREYGTKVEPQIKKDARFADVVLHCGSTSCKIRIEGTVASEPDLLALDDLVKQTSPPVEVVNAVKVKEQ
jgi:hypothetical protein